MKFFIAAFFILWIACDRVESPHKAQFDKLEKVFGNANWQVLRGKDTMYAFFTRENDVLYKLYSYYVKNGDSALTLFTTIYAAKDEILWYTEGDDDGYRYLLEHADDTSNLWTTGGGASLTLQFTRKDSRIIAGCYHDRFCGWRSSFPMVRTLPISSFLARSKYDYLHGTNTVDEE